MEVIATVIAAMLAAATAFAATASAAMASTAISIAIHVTEAAAPVAITAAAATSMATTHGHGRCHSRRRHGLGCCHGCRRHGHRPPLFGREACPSFTPWWLLPRASRAKTTTGHDLSRYLRSHGHHFRRTPRPRRTQLCSGPQRQRPQPRHDLDHGDHEVSLDAGDRGHDLYGALAAVATSSVMTWQPWLPPRPRTQPP